MWKKCTAVLLGTLIAGSATAGTLIYRNAEKEIKTISQITLLSFDQKRMIIKANRGTETIPIGNVLKYYNSNIKSGEFDDSSAEYDIRLGSARVPKRGEVKKKGKKEIAEFAIAYSITPKMGERRNRGMRTPYFYLFVLAADPDGGRSIYTYSYPKQAKANLNTYDEIKMLERVISLDRPRIYPDDKRRLGVPTPTSGLMGGEEYATFKLTGIKNREIIAWHVIAWGKNEVEAAKGDTANTSYQVSPEWWIQ